MCMCSYFSTRALAWKEPWGAKLTQVECVRSMHGNLLSDKSMLQVSVGWPRDMVCCESQKFQVSTACMSYQLDRSYKTGIPLHAT